MFEQMDFILIVDFDAKVRYQANESLVSQHNIIGWKVT